MSKLTGDEISRYSPWAPEEDALILAAYRDKGYQFIRRKLPHRSEKSIQRRASRLGATRRLEKPRCKPKDEPLVTKREEKRNSRSCYGYIPGGPVRSIFELGERA